MRNYNYSSKYITVTICNLKFITTNYVYTIFHNRICIIKRPGKKRARLGRVIIQLMYVIEKNKNNIIKKLCKYYNSFITYVM